MLAFGVERTEGTLTNITFLQGSSYDLGPRIVQQFGPFHLVTIGRAFHWMDRADTLRRLDALIGADGAIVLFSDSHPDVPDNAWLTEFRAIRLRHTGEDRAAWRQPDWPSHTALLLDSATNGCVEDGLATLAAAADGLSALPQGTDLMEISRPDGIGDIAKLGLTLSEAKQLLANVQSEMVLLQGRFSAVILQ
jgi:hypothetical protein